MGTIDPKSEQAAREILGRAVRGEIEDLAMLISAIGGEQYRRVLSLCLFATTYVAVDVSGRWPTEADVRKIARIIVGREQAIELNEADVYDYVFDAALRLRPLQEALGSAGKAAALPVLVTGKMLFRFRPPGLTWWEYLDRVWNASLAAETLDLSALPALLIRDHRAKGTSWHLKRTDRLHHLRESNDEAQGLVASQGRAMAWP